MSNPVVSVNRAGLGSASISIHRPMSASDQVVYDLWKDDRDRVNMARDALSAIRRMSVGEFTSSGNGVHAVVSVSIGDLHTELKVTPYLKTSVRRTDESILESTFSRLCEFSGSPDRRIPRTIFPIQVFFEQMVRDLTAHSYSGAQEAVQMCGVVLVDQMTRDRFESSMIGGIYLFLRKLDNFLATGKMQSMAWTHGLSKARAAMEKAAETASAYGIPLEEMEILLREAYVRGVMGS